MANASRSDWKTHRFDEMATEVKDRVEDPRTSGFDRYVGLTHLDPGSLKIWRWGSTQEVAKQKKLFKSGDIIFGRRNAYLRRVSVADFDGVCSAHAMVLRSQPEVVLPAFLPFFMQTEMFWQAALRNSAGSLSPTINWSNIAKEEFALPSLEEQRRIAVTLLAFKRAQESYFETAASMRALRASLIVHRVGTESLTLRGRLDSVREPQSGWTPLKLSDLSDVVRGSTPRPARDPRYFGGNHLPWITVGELTKDDSPYLEKTESMLTAEGATKSRVVPEGTVVLSNSGFSLGIPKILRLTGCANDGVAAFLGLDARLEPLFLYYWLLGLTEYFRKVVAAGGDQPNLNTKRIGDLVIEVPPIKEQREVVALLQQIDRALERTLQRLDASRNLSRDLLNQALVVTEAEHAQ